jgi:Mg-dependent DNase
MKTFIDTHAHLCEEYYPDNLDQVVQRAIEAKVDPIILPGVNAAGIPEILENRKIASKACLSASRTAP